ncbi:MAG TPA: hypothetical protein PKX05_02075 [bacterium]|nr:hypothetical protein [bacterium]
MGKFRRRRYLINKPIQLGYFGLTAWFICLGIMLVGSLTYYFTLSTIIGQIEVTNPGFDVMEAVGEINLILQKKIALIFVFLVIIAAGLVIFYLHRVVGPIYRIEKTLREVVEGKPFQDIKIRRKDNFQTLADTINKFVRYNEIRFQQIKEILNNSEIPELEKINQIKKFFKD